MKHYGPSHKSVWKTCSICHQEFLAYTATICRPCQRKTRQQVEEEAYERLVEKGGVAEL